MMEILHIKYNLKVVVIIIVIIILAGCENTSDVNTINDANLQIDEVVLPVKKGDSIGSYCVEGDIVYYSLNPTVGDLEVSETSKFTADMMTKIYKYNTLSGETTLLYCYDVDWQIDVNDMGICGNILYWDDNLNRDGFQVVGYDLGENKFIGNIFYISIRHSKFMKSFRN